MSTWTPKYRLAQTLGKHKPDRPPVICTGGMMNAAIQDVMSESKIFLPAAHTDAEGMASLALAVQERTGFENIGLPFCMTVEAEALGSQVDLGTFACEPKVVKEQFASIREVSLPDLDLVVNRSRLELIAEASGIAALMRPEVPVIASLTGPVSTAASWVDPIRFLKDLRRDPQGSHEVLEYVTEFLVRYLRLMVRKGKASAIAIGDPTATGEILGPKIFEAFAYPCLERLAQAAHEEGVPLIIHICGDLKSIQAPAAALSGDALSTDSLVSLPHLKEKYPHVITMGNVSTYRLERDQPEQIAAVTRRLVSDGVDIISPACGLSTSTPIANIQAMTLAVKEKDNA